MIVTAFITIRQGTVGKALHCTDNATLTENTPCYLNRVAKSKILEEKAYEYEFNLLGINVLHCKGDQVNEY